MSAVSGSVSRRAVNSLFGKRGAPNEEIVEHEDSVREINVAVAVDISGGPAGHGVSEEELPEDSHGVRDVVSVVLVHIAGLSLGGRKVVIKAGARIAGVGKSSPGKLTLAGKVHDQ